LRIGEYQHAGTHHQYSRQFTNSRKGGKNADEAEGEDTEMEDSGISEDGKHQS
jgi:hypothetical protein